MIFLRYIQQVCNSVRFTELLFLSAAVMLHEAAHIITAAALGSPVKDIRLSCTGLVLHRGFSDYRTDARIAAAGPLINIILAMTCSYAAKWGVMSRDAYFFAGINLLTGVYNLIPALPMDGGVIMFSILARKLDYDRACRIADTTAFVCGVILMTIGLDIVIKTRYNVSILAGSAMIIGGLYAKGAGKDLTEGHKAREIRRRRVRTDH